MSGAHAIPDVWNDYEFVVQMPHMAPGEKLAEVEFLKLIAAHQWESIARALRIRPPEIRNDQRERLYGSVIDVELCLGPRHSLEILGEDVRIHVKNRVRFYARKFVEGLFVIDDREIPDAVVASVKTREDLRALGTSWACMTNAFIARGGGNLRLKVFRPAGTDALEVPELEAPPFGIVEQGRVLSSGRIAPLGNEADGLPLAAARNRRILYRITPESDLNGAGLVYFARYEAMMDYGERIFLTRSLEHPISSELVAHLSTEHRRTFFFANASPTDDVDVRVDARVLLPGTFPAAAPGPLRVPLKLVFRIDLYRASDNVLMASSLVRKALCVPGSAKNVLAEADRLLRRLGGATPSGSGS